MGGKWVVKRDAGNRAEPILPARQKITLQRVICKEVRTNQKRKSFDYHFIPQNLTISTGQAGRGESASLASHAAYARASAASLP